MSDELIKPVPGPVHFADLGTHRIAYVEAGSGHPVIFMHGGLMDHQSWGNQLPLAAHYRLILPDTRGHGRSTGADLPATYKAFGEDVVALMDELGIKRAAIVGFSDGGCAALHIAVDRPERVSALVLIGSPYHLDAYNPGVVDRFHTMRKADVETSTSPVLADVLPKMRAHMTEAEWDAYWDRIVRRLWVSEPSFALSDFADLPMPALILHGEFEKSVSVQGSEDLARTIPDAELVYVPGASHPAAQEQPDFVNAAIRHFLAAKIG